MGGSNSRSLTAYLLSKQAHSATLPTLRIAVSPPTAKGVFPLVSILRCYAPACAAQSAALTRNFL